MVRLVHSAERMHGHMAVGTFRDAAFRMVHMLNRILSAFFVARKTGFIGLFAFEFVAATRGMAVAALKVSLGGTGTKPPATHGVVFPKIPSTRVIIRVLESRQVVVVPVVFCRFEAVRNRATLRVAAGTGIVLLLDRHIVPADDLQIFRHLAFGGFSTNPDVFRCRSVAGLAANAGLEGSVVVEKVKDLEDNVGLNALTGEYVNMFEAGIIDPAKVTRSAGQNAASIAGLLLTTEALIADKPEEEGMPAMPGGMGGMPPM